MATAPSATSSDVARLQQTMVDMLVERYDVVTHAQDVNRDTWRLSTRALSELAPVTSALEKMQRYSAAVVRASARWRDERQRLNSAVLHHSKLLAFTEAPALLAECMQHELYAEALHVLQRIQMFVATTAAAAAPDMPTKAAPADAASAAVDANGDDDNDEAADVRAAMTTRVATGVVVERMRRAADAVLLRSVDELLRVRLTRALGVDAAFHAVHLLRRLGAPPRALRRVFLQRRGVYIRALYDAADAATPLAYARVLRYLSVYKVHVSEVVLQYHACFLATADGGVDGLLARWCRVQAAALVRRVRDAAATVTSAAELATMAEQCGGCAVPSAKAHMNVSSQLSDVLIARMRAVVDEHMHGAVRVYRTCMMAHSWKSDGQHAQPSSSPPPSARAAPHVDTDATTTTMTADEHATPPLALTQWLPLAYALNGLLMSCNAVRKCMLPGLDVHLAHGMAELVQCIAADLHRDTALLASMEATERAGLVSFVRAFVQLFVPHVLYCARQLLSAPVQRLLRERVTAHTEALERLCAQLA